MLHYGIVGKVGEGGMGRVYKAEGHETRLNDYPAPVVAWKVHAAIARLESKSGDATSADEHSTRAREIVDSIGANVADEKLRDNFLTAAHASIEK